MLTWSRQAGRRSPVNSGHRETPVVIGIRIAAQALHACCSVFKYYKVGHAFTLMSIALYRTQNMQK